MNYVKIPSAKLVLLTIKDWDLFQFIMRKLL